MTKQTTIVVTGALRVKRVVKHQIITFNWLASVAQLDACPTGNQEVAGSTPAGAATSFSGD